MSEQIQKIRTDARLSVMFEGYSDEAIAALMAPVPSDWRPESGPAVTEYQCEDHVDDLRDPREW